VCVPSPGSPHFPADSMAGTALWIPLCVLTATITATLAIHSQDLYPFGTEHGDERLPIGDDEHSSEFQLSTPIAFYDYRYRSLYINTNGVISFEREYPQYSGDLYFPVGVKVIAPFLADVDTRLSGNIFYRETADPSLLDMASRDIQKNFVNQFQFRATNALIATWQEVGYHRQQYDRTNTFQVVIASDGFDSFTFFLYEDNGVQWVRGQGKDAPGIPDQHAHAGFDSGDLINYYTLQGSGQPNVQEIARSSNVGVPGKWLFHIGLVDNEIGLPRGAERVEQPEIENEISEDPYNRQPAEPVDVWQSCASGGSRMCSRMAQCRDQYAGGYCCECAPPQVGNGYNCQQPSAAARINGKVTGMVNGNMIDSQDMHAYVITKDGRSYIAIAKLSSELGTAMQAAFSVGSLIGWLYAEPGHGGAQNGIMITGGTFNRTATVTYMPGREKLEIKQSFVNDGTAGFLRVTTTLSGNIPRISAGEDITVADYTEVYRKESPGVYKTYVSHAYEIGGVKKTFMLDQTIAFKEPCSDRVPHAAESISVKVARVYIIYGEDEEIVRYAWTNEAHQGDHGPADPCLGYNDCATDAMCLPESGGQYRCECPAGFAGDGYYCSDIDECYRGDHHCDENAECTNTPGSHDCTCMQGYKGDGMICYREQSCSELLCHTYAQCYHEEGQDAMCECNAGYIGDGENECEPIVFGCNEVDNCDPNADCVYDQPSAGYMCECMDGFSGDGYFCSDSDSMNPCDQCDMNARCSYDVNRMNYRCICVEGWTGDGQTCSFLGDVESCNVLNNCDLNARCEWNSGDGNYQCQCMHSFVGNGYRCEPDDVPSVPSTCQSVSDCHQEADCTYSAEHSQYVCTCNTGFTGNGYFCTEENCNINPSNCDTNAMCVYEPYSQRHTCRCNPGFEGDGQYCRQQADCSLEASLCDGNAHCTRRADLFVCACNQGYRGDGHTCAPLGDAASYLLYAQGATIMEIPFQPTDDQPGKRVLKLDGQTAIGLDVDCMTLNIFWTDVSTKSIYKAKLDGTEQEAVVTDAGSPEGITIDWLSKNMYWTDSIHDRIEVARLDGSHRTVLFDEGLINPRGIVSDPSRGLIFWTDWNRDGPKIESAYMDGTNRKVIVNTDLALPNSLTLDVEAQQVCWSDAGTQNIECAGYDGRVRRVVYGQASYPFGIAFANDKFYWTDWDMKSLPSIDKYGGEANAPLQLPEGGNGRMYGLVAVRETCPPVSNACVNNNGGCRFLCLPTPNGGHTCLCSGDIPEEECNEIGLLL